MEKFNSMLSVLKGFLWTDRGACAVVGRTLVAALCMALLVSHMGELWSARITTFGGLSAFVVIMAVGSYAWKCVYDCIALAGGDGKEEPVEETPGTGPDVEGKENPKPVVPCEGTVNVADDVAFATGWEGDDADGGLELPFTFFVVEKLKRLDSEAVKAGVGLHKEWKASPELLDAAFNENVAKKFGKPLEKPVKLSVNVEATLVALGSLYHSTHRLACCLDSRLKVLAAYRVFLADGTERFVSRELEGLHTNLEGMYNNTYIYLKKCRKALKLFGAPDGVIPSVVAGAGYIDGDGALKKALVILEAVLSSRENGPDVDEESGGGADGGRNEGTTAGDGGDECQPEKVDGLPPHPKRREFKARPKYRDFGSWANENRN